MKKLLTLLLALVMLFTLAMPAAATSKRCSPFRILTIGDSTSNGYFLNDYGVCSGADWGDGNDNYGAYDYASKKSFSFLLKDYLQESFGTSRTVEMTNLTFEGMRTDELRAILDPAYLEKAYADNNVFCTGHMAGYNWWYRSNYEDIFERGFTKVDINEIGEKRLLTAVFEDAISDANLIVLDVITNNFGTYFTSRLQGILGMENKEYYSESVMSLAEDIAVPIPEIESMITGMLNEFLPDDLSMIGELIDLFTYCYCDFRANFPKDIELIRKLNPDAKIVVVTPFNAMEGLVISLNGVQVDVGALWACYVGMANTYLTGECLLRGTYSVANCFDSVETLTASLRKAETSADIYPRFAEILLTEALKDSTATPEETLTAVLNTVKKESFDIGMAMDLLTSGVDIETAAVTAASDWENATEGEQIALYVYCNFMSCHGMGAHPSEAGCYSKFAAIRSALGKPFTLISDGVTATVDIAAQVRKVFLRFNGSLLNSVVSTVKNNLIKAICR